MAAFTGIDTAHCPRCQDEPRKPLRLCIVCAAVLQSGEAERRAAAFGRRAREQARDKMGV